jgi:DNA-binding Xre family transcriptional regulator
MIVLTLDELLEARGKSFYWLAQQSGISESVLSKYRHNKVLRADLGVLARICDALGCQPADFIGNVPNKGGRASAKKS